MTRSIAVLFAVDLGASTFQIGTLVAIYALFPIMLAIHAGKAADIVGERIPILFGMIGMALGMVLPWAYPGLEAIYVSQLLVGVAHLFAVISLQNFIGRRSPDDRREHYFGMFSTSVSLANVAGPVTGGFLAQHFYFTSAYLGAVAVGVFAALLSLALPSDRPAKTVKEPGHPSTLSLLKSPLIRRALLSSALVLYSRDVFVTYFPLYAQGYGISVLVIGWILSIQGLSMVLVRSFLPRLTAFFGRDRVLIVSICTAGLAFMLVPTTQSALLLGIIGAVMGMGLGCGQPLSMVETYNASPKARTGEVLGLRMSANRLSQFAAPLFFGIVGSSLGVLSIFLISGAFLLGGGYLVRPRKT
jgi:predicted MFS family arabinose efflux permease